MRKIKTAADILIEGKESYYKNPDADAKYEKAYLLGWLQGEYNRIADELRELKTRKKAKHEN